MKEIWTIVIKTSLPDTCECIDDVRTTVETFDSFGRARLALRDKLKEYAFSKNGMFDGEGRITSFNEYYKNMYLYQPKNSECKPLVGSGLLDITTFFDASDTKNLQESADQRSRKGYCDYDLMDMDVWLMSILPDMLREMKQRTILTPFEFVEEEYKQNRELYPHLKEDELHIYKTDKEERQEWDLLDDNAHKRWQDTLEEIATAFDALADTDTFGLGYEEEPAQYQERLEAQKDKAFDLLKRWFFSLCI